MVVTDTDIEDWRQVHNAIIPDELGFDDVRERLQRNHLDVAYLGEALVACTTVRPPSPDSAEPIVIVRVLPDYRRQGIGATLLERALGQAAEFGGEGVATIVWEPNVDGLRFATAHGFTDEIDRYVPDGETSAYLTLRRTK